MKSPARLLVLGLYLATVPVALQSQATPAATDKDVAEIQQYTLTMEKVTRFAQVFGDLAKLAKDNPQLTSAMESSADGHESIDGIEKRISAEPRIVAAITDHGFTTHEFIVLEVTIFQAAMAAAAKQQGADSAKLIVEGHVNPANVAFMEQHKAEFEELQKKYGTAQSSD
jgi:hypothetical protein